VIRSHGAADRRHRVRACAWLALAALSGCAGRPTVVSEPLPAQLPREIELNATPFFPQREHQCGPAALATVLAASGVDVTADELTDKVFLPGRRGSLQIELIAAARGYDRLPYRLEPQFGTLLEELAAGRPVLVLQNLGLRTLPVWHYAVVVGFDTGRGRIILRSGTTERLEMSAHRFIRSWERADQWALLLLKPGEMPVNVDRDRYLEGATGLESAKHYAAALRAYQAASDRWPREMTVWLGIGNVHYRQHELAAAEQAYRRLLAIDARQAVGRNNLAQVLLEQGRPREALEEIGRAQALLDDQRFAPLLKETENEIRGRLAFH
jgi:tetratricopeptide (TPR) repeat protein